MEFYFLASGIKHELELFENALANMPFLLPFRDKNGKEFKQPIYGLLAPIQLYKFVFPKEALGDVLKTLPISSGSYLSQFDKQAFILRKAMKAKKIPKNLKGTKRFFPELNIAIKAIGIKPDEERTDEQGRTYEGI